MPAPTPPMPFWRSAGHAMSWHPLYQHPYRMVVYLTGVLATATYPWLYHHIFLAVWAQLNPNNPPPQVTTVWGAIAVVSAIWAPIALTIWTRVDERNERRREAERKEQERNLQGQLDDARKEIVTLKGRATSIEVTATKAADTAVAAAEVAAVTKTEAAGNTGRIDAIARKLQDMKVFKPPEGMKQPRPTLLIVEDEEEQMQAFADWFLGNGYAVTTAASMDKALAAVAKGPHWVILDLRIGGHDGLDILRKIKTDGLKTKVIIATGVDDPAVLAEARTLGARQTFVKPLDPRELLRTMTEES